MSDDSQENKPEPSPRKALDLSNLLPAKAPAQTSIGKLFVRHSVVQDLLDWSKNQEAEALGHACLRALTSRVEERSDNSSLSENDIDDLTKEDQEALIAEIAKVNGWKDVEPESIQSLGDAVKGAVEEMRRRSREQAAAMTKQLDTAYGFLGKDKLATLNKQMGDISAFRKALGEDNPILRAMREQDKRRNLMLGEDNPVLRAMREQDKLRDLISGRPIGKLEQSLRVTDGASDDLANKLSRDTAKATDLFPPGTGIGEMRVPKYEPPMIFRPEDSTLGRAQLESAAATKATGERIEALLDVVSGLNQTIVNDILPAWGKQVSDGQEGAKVAFRQAAESIRLAKVAIYISVGITIFVTVAATWWQVHVAEKIDKGNSEQLDNMKSIMEKQLAAQQRLIDQQAIAAAALQKEVASLKPAQSSPTQKPKPSPAIPRK